MIIFHPYLGKGWELLELMGFIRFCVSQHCDVGPVGHFLAGVAPNVPWLA